MACEFLSWTFKGEWTHIILKKQLCWVKYLLRSYKDALIVASIVHLILIHRLHILDIISYIAKQQLICYVYTSGIYMKDEVYSSLPNEYIEAIRGMVNKVIFNVEADSSTLYDQIMGTDVGGFDMMKKSINDCVSSGF